MSCDTGNFSALIVMPNAILRTEHALVISVRRAVCVMTDATSRDDVALELRMKRTIYYALMSLLIGSIIGAVVTNVVNIMYPDLGLDYGLAISFFIVLTWAFLSLIGMVFRRS
jgi:hypothetical protein